MPGQSTVGLKKLARVVSVAIALAPTNVLFPTVSKGFKALLAYLEDPALAIFMQAKNCSEIKGAWPALWGSYNDIVTLGPQLVAVR
eukprot:5929529-Alexandrium_andersonii.AAC.1